MPHWPIINHASSCICCYCCWCRGGRRESWRNLRPAAATLRVVNTQPPPRKKFADLHQGDLYSRNLLYRSPCLHCSCSAKVTRPHWICASINTVNQSVLAATCELDDRSCSLAEIDASRRCHGCSVYTLRWSRDRTLNLARKLLALDATAVAVAVDNDGDDDDDAVRPSCHRRRLRLIICGECRLTGCLTIAPPGSVH